MNLQYLSQMYAQFQRNPMGMLARRFNIPQGMNSPQDIVQHLLNSNQVTQDQVNGAMQQLRNMPGMRNMFR